jgi:PAS domain-containing protein
MKNENNKTKKELIEEIDELRHRVTQLEASEVNRELLEKALEKSETKFRGLTERSVVGAYLIQNGLFRYVNPRLAEIFGYKPEEIIDRLPPRTLVYKEDRRRLAESKP